MERKSKIALAIIIVAYIVSGVAAIISVKKNKRDSYAEGYMSGANETIEYFYDKHPELIEKLDTEIEA